MKKAIVLFVSIIIFLCFCACGNDGTQNSNISNNPDDTKNVVSNENSVSAVSKPKEESESIEISNPKCEHKNTIKDAAVAATCTAEGKTEGSHCADCGEVITAQKNVEKAAHTEKADTVVEATCLKEGKKGGSHCSVCGIVIKEATTISALGHNYVNGKCSRCGAEDSSSIRVQSVLKNIERYPKYIYYDAEILKGYVDLYDLNGKFENVQNIMDYVEKIKANTYEIQKACKDVKELYPLYLQACFDAPVLTGTSLSAIRSYCSSAKLYAERTGRIKMIYDTECEYYGLA